MAQLPGAAAVVLLLAAALTTAEFATSPYSIVWDVPAQGCERRDPFHLSRYGIVTNGGNDSAFDGPNMTIFYGNQLGAWPELGPNGTSQNGGIPQLGNLTHHLDKVHEDVARLLPNASFSGLAVIDWEAWRVLYDLNYDSLRPYQEASLALVRQQHPSWTNASQIELQAKADFDAAAKAWFLGTLNALKALRPHGYFGYYEYPYACGVAPGDHTCSNASQAQNDRLQWLWDASTVLAPSIYQHQVAPPLANWTGAVFAHVSEAVRVSRAGAGRAVVMPYGTPWAGGDFLPAANLEVQLRAVRQAGAAGVVLWGSSSASRNCSGIQTYVDTMLGPMAARVLAEADACARDTCSDHGRCASAWPLPTAGTSVGAGGPTSCLCWGGRKSPDCAEARPLPAVASGACRYYPGVQPLGALMWGKYPVENTTACCTLCQAQYNCQASGWHTSKVCYLFSSINGTNITPDYTACFARAPFPAPATPVAVAVDWGRQALDGGPAGSGVVANPRLFGLNLYSGSVAAVASDPAYLAGVGAMRPGFARFMRMDKGGHGTWAHDLGTSAYGWNATEIAHSLAALGPIVRPLLGGGASVLVGTENWPAYIADPTTGFIHPDNYTLFADFAAELVRILNKDLGLGVTYFEVFNEADSQFPGPGNMTALGTLFAKAAARMRAVDPSIRVGGPAFARPDLLDNVRAFVAAGGSELDFVSYHSYSTGSNGELTSAVFDSAAALGNITRSLRAVVGATLQGVARAAGRAIELLHDEFNISWDPPDPRMADVNSAVYDALALRSLTLARADAAAAWNECDGWYGKIDNHYSNYSRRPASYLYEYYNRYIREGMPMVQSESNATDRVQVAAFGGAGAGEGSDSTVLCLINRAGSNQTVRVRGYPSAHTAPLAAYEVSALGGRFFQLPAKSLAAGFPVVPGVTLLVASLSQPADALGFA